MKPLCIDLFCGLGGGLKAFSRIITSASASIWSGRLRLGRVSRSTGPSGRSDAPWPQLRNAACIVASPPCQNYSYMSMPWSRAKAMAGRVAGSPERIAELNRLFVACFRIQREASAAAGITSRWWLKTSKARNVGLVARHGISGACSCGAMCWP